MQRKKHLFLVLSIFAVVRVGQAQNDSVANSQHAMLGMAPLDAGTALSNPDPRAAWFPKAGMGLFIHWGPIASFGGGDISWCMMANKSWVKDLTITPNYYYSFMEKWNPANWNPDEIIRKAKEAGFQYAVLTTKHHDGYTLWPSKYGDLGTQTKLKGRDLVKPFVDACRKYGLKVGFYYSPPDWWFVREYRNWSLNSKLGFLDMDHKKIAPCTMPVELEEKRKELVANHVRELLTRYGKIDMIWFDGGRGEIANEEIRTMQPGIVINRRNGKDQKGDFGDSEGVLPEKRFAGWFETNKPVWPVKFWSHVTSAGYLKAEDVISEVILLRAWGGNYLANTGPRGDGSLHEETKAAMKGMAQWMKHSSESILDVQGGNYPELSTVPVTVKGNTLYAFAMPAYCGYIRVKVNRKPAKVTLLRTGDKLEYTYENNQIDIQVPPGLRTQYPDAIKIVVE